MNNISKQGFIFLSIFSFTQLSAGDKYPECKHHIMISGLDLQSYTDSNGYLAIRSGPGGKYRLLKKVINGDYVKGCSVKGNWVKIIYGCAESGDLDEDSFRKCKWGWVYKKYLSPVDGWNMKR